MVFLLKQTNRMKDIDRGLAMINLIRGDAVQLLPHAKDMDSGDLLRLRCVAFLSFFTDLETVHGEPNLGDK